MKKAPFVKLKGSQVEKVRLTFGSFVCEIDVIFEGAIELGMGCRDDES
jgi:hypothetical protein